ncbi:hypothetical protein NPIL_122371 [Nephila pilipes]|uniref:Uncharacterized protein n=1 Tax=Nephila pilipes TaxID=299642 RepID=A0A8X6R4R2_NEPPI|nr:hypothetical protein NPIL_173391 [Nephila pilipes]GFU49249.1 hypothetical protein NPIL_122371 [Nephila pilipes]
MCGLPEFSTRELRGWGSSEIQENSVDDEVLAESSFIALTDCQAPDLKGRLSCALQLASGRVTNCVRIWPEVAGFVDNQIETAAEVRLIKEMFPLSPVLLD